VDVNDYSSELKDVQIEGSINDQTNNLALSKTKHKRTPNAFNSEGSNVVPSAGSSLISNSVSSVDNKYDTNETPTIGKRLKEIRSKHVKVKDIVGGSHDSAENESSDSSSVKEVKRRKSRIMNAFKNMKQKIKGPKDN